jgi:hypothetical protein
VPLLKFNLDLAKSLKSSKSLKKALLFEKLIVIAGSNPALGIFKQLQLRKE